MNNLKKQRLEQTKRLMEAHRIDLLVAASTDSIQNRGNVRFLTNYPTVYGSSLAVLKRDEEPSLIVPAGSFQVGWAQRTAWTNDIRAAHNLASAVGSVLEELNNEPGTVGLVGFDFQPESLTTQITSPFKNINFKDLSIPFRLMKAVKSRPEIAMAKKSVSLADTAFVILANSTSAGTSEPEMFAGASNIVIANGGEDVFLLGSTDPQTVISYPAEREIKKGDLIRFSIEPASRGGFWSQTIRTYSVGIPSVKAQAAFDLCKDAILKASEEIKPGKTGGEIANSMIEVLKRNKDGKIGPLGHGMGLDLTEPPFMLPQDKTIIKPGMVITLHPSFTWDDVDIWMGDTFLVTDNGVENLSNYQNELVIL